MKIKISNDEFYEIKLPEQIEINEFSAIVNKFNFLLRNFQKFDIGNLNNIKKGEDIVINPNLQRKNNKFDKERWKLLRDNRDIFVEILKTHYLGTNKDFENVIKKYGTNFMKKECGSSSFVALREMHKIKPQEVGLSNFPTKFIQARDLRLNKNRK
jgi:hypothetical protein